VGATAYLRTFTSLHSGASSFETLLRAGTVQSHAELWRRPKPHTAAETATRVSLQIKQNGLHL